MQTYLGHSYPAVLGPNNPSASLSKPRVKNFAPPEILPD
jgi:hypothetical protein